MADDDQVREAVRARYAEAATASASGVGNDELLREDG
ncbi:arsenite S-adenosylmethyltransferase, partial [Burkholderia multivorans]